MAKFTPEILSKIAFKTEEPCVVRNFEVPWKCLGSDLTEWCEIFDEIHPQGVVFEKASQMHGQVPQWEYFREKTPKTTLKDFLSFSESEESNNSWLSYSYKSLRDLPGKIREEIDFSPLGFPEIKDDITLWLGSKGAHTPCHYDTYGRNIVIQVYGHKRWILFSPEANLQATRIPFEESSVYSSLNFFSPQHLSQFDGISDQAHIVTLNPGDVLIVPPKWWHYVENLETALTLNAWIPIEEDTDAQIRECFTKSIIFNFLRDVDSSLRKFLVYPNEMDIFDMDPIDFTKLHLEVLKHLRNVRKSIPNPNLNKNILSNEEWTDLLSKNSSIEIIKRTSKQEFLKILDKNSNDRFLSSWQFQQFDESKQLLIDELTEFINSLCDIEATDRMKQRYLGPSAATFSSTTTL
ncbi:HSPB1-associated protein 1 [Phlebotomus papatasi]|uniref:HSPB1-associated protein 1 n=1 Tax=Phlebotomus papatasi TaxID=29031 RepID=UPI002483D1B5|nr:HSPB1-associated protein 1 [Phlebotomus papatasi]